MFALMFEYNYQIRLKFCLILAIMTVVIVILRVSQLGIHTVDERRLKLSLAVFVDFLSLVPFSFFTHWARRCVQAVQPSAFFNVAQEMLSCVTL